MAHLARDNLHEFYDLKQDVNIDDNIPIISPETFYILNHGKVESLAKYFLPRLKYRNNQGVEFDLTCIIQKPLIVTISQVVGDIYYDKEFVPDMLVGYFNGYKITSTNAKLANPHTIADLCMVYTTEQRDKMERLINAGHQIDKDQFVPRQNFKKFEQYLLDAKCRPEDPTAKDDTVFYYNGLSLKNAFYKYLKANRINV